VLYQGCAAPILQWHASRVIPDIRVILNGVPASEMLLPFSITGGPLLMRGKKVINLMSFLVLLTE